MAGHVARALAFEYGLAIWIGAPALVAAVGVVGVWLKGRNGKS